MNSVKKIKINALVTAILTLAAGIVFVINPTGTANFLATFAGIFVVVVGAIDLIIYIRNSGNPFISQNKLLTGVLKMVIGVFMVTHSDMIITLISYLFSIYIIVDGLKMLDNSITLAKVKATAWFIHLIFAIVMIGAGVVMLFKPLEAAGTVTFWMGIILIFDAVSALITIIRLAKFNGEIKKTFKYMEDETNGNIIDVEAKETK